MRVIITTPTSNWYRLLWWYSMCSYNMWHYTLTTNCNNIYFNTISMIISDCYISLDQQYNVPLDVVQVTLTAN